jgi:hypothetical protein
LTVFDLIASSAINKVKQTIFLYFLNDKHMKGKDIQMQSMLGDQETNLQGNLPTRRGQRHAMILEAMI